MKYPEKRKEPNSGITVHIYDGHLSRGLCHFSLVTFWEHFKAVTEMTMSWDISQNLSLEQKGALRSLLSFGPFSFTREHTAQRG